MDTFATTLCQLIKQAASDDLENKQLKKNAFVAISKIIKQIPQAEKYNPKENEEFKKEFENVIKILFYYLIYQESKVIEDISKSSSINHVLEIDNQIVNDLKKEREKVNDKGEKKNKNYKQSIDEIFRDFSKEAKQEIPSKIIWQKINQFFSQNNNYQTESKAIFDYLQKQQEYENPAETISMMLYQNSKIESFVPDNLRKYYKEALAITEKDVKKNLHKFVEKYQINFSIINCQNQQDKNEIQRLFISWTSTILKADCLDIYRKQKTRVKNNQPALVNTSLNQKKGQDESQREIIDEISESEITLSGLDKIIKTEQTKINTRIIEYIKEDPHNKLKDCYPQNNPDCNCQALLKKRLIEGEDNITKIANEFGVPRATLQDFLEYRLNSKRPDAKCLRLLRKEIETKYQINLSEYKNI
jgi:DNA-directed RNA polymerase specialized sigma24 family protein